MTAEAGAGLSAAFAAYLGGAPAEPAPARLLGLEHEYQLWHDGRQLDFREIIHSLQVPGRRLDPGDTNAYRLQSGLALTCDDAEAEVASPPLAVLPEFTRRLDGWATAGYGQLAGLLPHDVQVSGYSTHLSASLAGLDQRPAVELFSRTFAPVLMLLLDEPDGFGVYVRPRPGRLELCAGYARGPYLRASAAFFAGGVRACVAALADDDAAQRLLPPTLAAQIKPATGRFGLYIGRRAAFGSDLYAAGREALLPLNDGDSIRAGEQLERAWQSSRQQIEGDAAPDELDLVDQIVAGKLPLRVEGRGDDFDVNARGEPSPADASLAALLSTRRRPAFEVAPLHTTWDFSILRIEGRGRRAFACLPRPTLGAFFAALDAGRLDDTIVAYLEAPVAGRRLQSNQATHAPGLWDELGAPLDLLPSEPDPTTGLYQQPVEAAPGPRSGKAAGRAGKPATGPMAAAAARPGKPSVAGRPGKPFILPARPAQAAPGLPRPLPAPPLPPNRPSETPPPPVVPPPPAEPAPAAPPPPVEPPGRPIVPFVVIGIIIAVVVALGAAAASGVFSNDTPSTPTPVATPVASPTPTPSVTPTPAASPTLEPSPQPTATAPVVAPAVSTPTPTPRPPTETPRPATETPVPPTATCAPPNAAGGCTPTPTPTCAPPGVIGACTPTPTRTATPTPTATRTPTATSTPCFVNGAVCTPTATKAAP